MKRITLFYYLCYRPLIMSTRVRTRIQSNVVRVIICLTFDSIIYPSPLIIVSQIFLVNYDSKLYKALNTNLSWSYLWSTLIYINVVVPMKYFTGHVVNCY